jgi:ferritin-like metal-binding protein YciE
MNKNVKYQDSSKLAVFFNNMINEMYWVEKHLSDVLNTMSQTATTEALRAAFDTHKKETEVQFERIQQIFKEINMPLDEKPSIGMQGLFDEGWQVIDETEDGSFQRDVALIIAAQKVEHYEIASYGSLINLATLLGFTKCVKLLQQSLQEEKETDLKLSQLAEMQINLGAKEEPVAATTKQLRTSKGSETKAKTPKSKTPMKEEREVKTEEPAKSKKTSGKATDKDSASAQQTKSSKTGGTGRTKK